ncbi:MAG: bifunctional riboflavin kinase/FAD synthetase [Planctomycetaceae bacterium]|nr:bifunctional riboflavin kinase/FAD synthetase [Planctomycetaceae bacterium]
MNERHIQGLELLISQMRGCVLTIGNFDGVHVGHRHIIARARALADGEGAPVVAMTFDPPPDLVMRPQDAPLRLTLPQRRAELLLEAGADYVVTARADKALLGLSAEDFITRVIVDRFAPRHMVEGGNFFFGAARAGNIELLRRRGAELGFFVHAIDPVLIELGSETVQISSTLIRSLVAAGRVEDAARCLGGPYTLQGPVVIGRRVGRSLGFPTCNIDIGPLVMPAQGVYAGWARVAGQGSAAAVSIGTQPTFDGDEVVVEAFLLDLQDSVYDKMMSLGLLARLRDQQRFAGPEALKTQISKDVQRVREICKRRL